MHRNRWPYSQMAAQSEPPNLRIDEFHKAWFLSDKSCWKKWVGDGQHNRYWFGARNNRKQDKKNSCIINEGWISLDMKTIGNRDKTVHNWPFISENVLGLGSAVREQTKLFVTKFSNFWSKIKDFSKEMFSIVQLSSLPEWYGELLFCQEPQTTPAKSYWNSRWTVSPKVDENVMIELVFPLL